MPNQEGTEPQNAAAEAMRDIQAMRGVNTTLRAAAGPEAPPMDDADFIEDYRRTTGLIINSNGEVIGRDPNWVGPAALNATVSEYGASKPDQDVHQPMNAPAPRKVRIENERVFEDIDSMFFKNGIDLDRKVVVIDGVEYEMSDEEVKGTMLFTSQVMIRSVERRAQQRLIDAGIVFETRGAADAVPEVQGGEAPRSVPKEPKPRKR